MDSAGRESIRKTSARARQIARRRLDRLRDDTHGPWSPHDRQWALEAFSDAGRWVGLALIVGSVALGIALAVRADRADRDDGGRAA